MSGPPLAFLAAATVVAGLLLAVPTAAQQTCPEGRRPTGDIGVESYLCVGGACAIWARTPRGLAHRFTTEPRVDRIDPDGPSAGALEEGDVLVAIDGVLITSAAGGRLLANLEPGVEVELWTRRQDRDRRVGVVPVPGCNPSALTVWSP